jgi:Holliday junction resolvasome RuvABC endonuclease subunit
LWRRGLALRDVPPQDGVVAGLDLSLTSTGFAAIRRGMMVGFAVSPPKGCRGAARLAFLDAEITALMTRYAVQLVALEGYAFGARVGREQAGELGGVVRLALHRAGVPFVVVPPSSLKAFATGKGNADKHAVGKELYKRWGVDLEGNDATDAGGLALIAFERLHSTLPLTQTQRAALAKITSD